MKPAGRGPIALCGWLGAGILIAGCIAPVFSYREHGGAGYSFLNHFVSELGRPSSSPLASVFNAGVAAGGVMIALFMLGLGRFFRTRMGWVAAGAGVLGGLAASGSGLVPINRLMPHLAFALTFFYGAWVAFGLFGLVIVRDKERRLPRWLAIPSLVTVASFALLIASPLLAGHVALESIRQRGFQRPAVWPAALFEWLVVTAVVSWIALVAACLQRRDGKPPAGAAGPLANDAP